MTQTIAILMITGILMGCLVMGVAMPTKQAFIFSMTLFAVLLGASIAIMSLRGTAKDMKAETARPKVAEVVWSGGGPSTGILLLLKWDDIPEPRYYRMNWSQDTERQISQASREARVGHGPVMLRSPFGGPGGQASEADEKTSGAVAGTPGVGENHGDNAGSGNNPFYAAPPPPREGK